METFIAIVVIVWSILCLVLFFKLWGMTNDVKKILETITPKQEDVTPAANPIEPEDIAKNECLMLKGDTLITNSGKFAYYGICEGRHALYPTDKETEGKISDNPKAIKDSLGKLYLGLNDADMVYLVDKYKKK